MLLTKLRLVNYRCYTDTTFDQLDRLAVFIGENDVGKTHLMNAVACLVGSGACADEDYRDIAHSQRSAEVLLEGVFRLEAHDTLPAEFRVEASGHQEFRLTKRFSRSGAEVVCRGMGFVDQRFDDFRGADNQKALLKAMGKTPAGREEDRKAQVEELVAEGKLERHERDLRLTAFAVIQSHMPRVERIDSAAFRSPDDVVNRVLRGVAASVLKPVDESTGAAVERPELKTIRAEIEQRLNQEIQRATDTLRRMHKNLCGLSVYPSIDFGRALSTSALAIDIGDGLRHATSFGRGTNNRLWMGLLEWERETTKQNVSTSVLRLYDEPDVNLHYEAQRELFNTIAELSWDTETRTQCFVCTHAVTLIDRAAPETIRLISVDTNDMRLVRRIAGGEDGAYAEFMDDLGRAVGLSNTALLYERAFIVVEGESEAAALPIIYRNLYGSSLPRDGIVLLNLHTCSAWRTALELLLRNRLAMTYLLLDEDCKANGSSGNVKPGVLAKLGAPEEFESKQVKYIGRKEFEDAFGPDVIAAALSAEYERADGSVWTASEIAALQTTAVKFSEALKATVRDAVVNFKKPNAKKEQIAACVARQCRERSQVPDRLIELFDAARATANLTSGAGTLPQAAG